MNYDSAGRPFHQQTENQLSWKEKRGRRDVVELITIDRLKAVEKKREDEKVSCVLFQNIENTKDNATKRFNI